MQARMKLSAIALTATSLILSASYALAANPVEARPVLVELFTSEGCSSCPPADDILRQINGRTTANGQLIIGLSEHVTYWNDLGWDDPYSQSLFTNRQSAYSDHFHLDGVYTPQAVINGNHQVTGSDGNAILRAIRSETLPSPITVHIRSAVLTDKTLAVTYTVTGSAPSSRVDIFGVIADDMALSHVLHGENSGHDLTHVSVARSMTRLGTLKPLADRALTANLIVPSAPPSGGRHIILFAQTADTGRIFSVESKAF